MPISDSTTAPPPILVSPDGASPLSFSEQVLWHAERGTPGPAFIECPRHLAIATRVIGPLDERALRAALDAILRRHPILRSRFVATPAGPRRMMRADATWPLATVAFAVAAGGPLPPALTDFIHREINAPFDLEAGPLYRGCLLTLGDADRVLVLTVHHLVFDGLSKRILARELEAQYHRAARLDGPAPPLAELAASYDDYAAWQRCRLDEPRTSRLAAECANRLAAVPAIPATTGASAVVSTDSRKHTVMIPAATADALRALSRRHRVSLATTLLAVFRALLAPPADPDVWIGVPISDRPRREFEEMIGLFVNLLLMRTVLPGDPTFIELLTCVRDDLHEAYRYQEVPYGSLASGVDGARLQACCRYVFNYVQVTGLELSLGGTITDDLPLDLDVRAHADLTLQVHARGGECRCVFVYRTARFSDAEIRQLADRFTHVIAEVLTNPSQSLPASAARQTLRSSGA